MMFLPKKVAWLSSWSTRCGIAEMSKTLLEGDISTYFDLKVFASQQNELDSALNTPVVRCWTDANDKQMSELKKRLTEFSPDVIVIQYNFGFFDASALADLLKLEEFKYTRKIIQFHAIYAPSETEPQTLKDSGLLDGVDSIIVHQIADLNELSPHCDKAKISIIPLPVHAITEANRQDWRPQARRLIGVQPDTLVLSTYGFLLPNKGLSNAVNLLSDLVSRNVDAHLLMVNAMYPAAVSQSEREALIEQIAICDIGDHVTLIDEFLEPEESLKILSAADLGVFMYDKTNESSSAAIRTVLGGRLPVVTNASGIFDDLTDIVLNIGESLEELSQSLEDIAKSKSIAQQIQEPKTQKDWIESHSDANTRSAYFQLLRGLAERPNA